MHWTTPAQPPRRLCDVHAARARSRTPPTRYLHQSEAGHSIRTPVSRFQQLMISVVPSLTPRERAALKGRAHALEPIVQVGQAGLTDAVVAETDRALAAHELIKVRVGGADREERAALVDALAARTDAAVVQSVGKIVVLWRPRAEHEDE